MKTVSKGPNRRSRKLLQTVSLTTAVLTLTAACGVGSDNSNAECAGAGGGGNAGKWDPARADIDWCQAAGATINVAHIESALMDEALKRKAEFEKMTGITVKTEGMGEDAMLDALTLDFTSGTGEYDVMQVAPYEVPRYADRGWVRNLNEFMNDSKLTDSDWYDYQDFLPALSGALKVGDYVAGAPLDGFPHVLFYRKDLFKKHNIEVPTTMEELAQAAAKLDKLDTNGDGNSDVSGIGLRGQYYQAVLQAFIYTAGGRYVSEDGSELELTNPDTIAGIQQYTDLIKNYAPPGYANITWAELLEDFQNGRLAMTIDALVWSQQFAETGSSEVAGKVGVAPMPGWNEGEQGEPGLWTWGLGVSSQSDNPEAAWLFVQWVTSKAKSLEMSQVRHATSRTSVTEHQKWKKTVGGVMGGEWMKRFTQDIDRANPNYHIVEAGGEPFPGAAEVLQTVGIEAQAAFAGEKSVERAMTDAEATLEREGVME